MFKSWNLVNILNFKLFQFFALKPIKPYSPIIWKHNSSFCELLSVKEWDWITFAVLFSFMEKRKKEYWSQSNEQFSWVLYWYISRLIWCLRTGDYVRTSHLFVLVNSFDLRLPLALGCVRPLKLPCTTQKYLNILFFELYTQLYLSSPPQFLLEKFRWQNSPSGKCYHLTGNISFPWERTLQVLWENCYWAINQ